MYAYDVYIYTYCQMTEPAGKSAYQGNSHTPVCQMKILRNPD